MAWIFVITAVEAIRPFDCPV